MSNPGDFSKLMESFQSLIGNRELVFQVFDLFPIPMQIFTPDGTSIFINRAAMVLNNITDASLIVGKYNIKNDPVCLKIFGQDVVDKAFRGEHAFFADFPAPIQDLVDRGLIEEKPFEAATMDVFSLPVLDGDKFLYVISLFIVKQLYRGKPEVENAKKYIDEHWSENFDAQAVAEAAHVSSSHLHVLFRNNTGMTMYDYYKKVNVDLIKEKLKDKSLSIAEAFAFCGKDNRGAFGRVFKELTGMTPTEYRNSL